MPVTLALYLCDGCRHHGDCPDYDESRRFVSAGIDLVEGTASVRCHFGQHDRRRDYQVTIGDGLGLKNLLLRFGFRPANEIDDGCLNVCHTCVRDDCPFKKTQPKREGSSSVAEWAARYAYDDGKVHEPRVNPIRTFFAQAGRVARNIHHFSEQMREVRKATDFLRKYGGSPVHDSVVFDVDFADMEVKAVAERFDKVNEALRKSGNTMHISREGQKFIRKSLGLE